MADCKTIKYPRNPTGQTTGGDDAVLVTGEFTNSGLSIAGRFTEVLLNSTTWTLLPDIGALTDRNGIAIQNQSPVEIKVNFSTPAGYVGMIVPAGGERFYDITDAIAVYAKSTSGASRLVGVEEIS